MTTARLPSLFVSVFLSGTVTMPAGDYEQIDHGAGKIHVYRARPAELSLHWKGAEGRPLRTFGAVATHLRSEGLRPVFLMNAGIFEPGGVPSGLHVEDGHELRPLNLSDGKGNFFLKPNGVFYIDGEGAHVVPSEVYAETKPSPRLALQSGPLLLHNGLPHPAFRAESESRLHRNGVGVLPDGRVVFLMTDFASRTRINLHGFATLFKSLGCADALFLDGDLSQMWVAAGDAPPNQPDGVRAADVPATTNHFGAVLAVAAAPNRPD